MHFSLRFSSARGQAICRSIARFFYWISHGPMIGQMVKAQRKAAERKREMLEVLRDFSQGEGRVERSLGGNPTT